jgi:hypothetical protein
LLPPDTNGDETLEELIYIFKSIQSPQRRATAMMLLKALLAEEEENEQPGAEKGIQ